MAKRIDPLTFEIVHAALLSVSDEMGAVLRRSSYSPIIRDMHDFSCALFDAEGRLVAQGEFIPAQLGAISLVVRAIIERHGRDLSPGDVFISNDPFAGGAHTPDVNIVRPVFVGRSGHGASPALLFGWAGTVAHQVDFGGRNPGTEGADNRQIFEEGLIIPPIRLERASEPVDEVVALIAANVRDPVSTLGDLHAQMAACRAGERRLLDLVAAHGRPGIEAVFRSALHEATRRMRLALGALPDGSAEAEGFMDDDGVGGPPVRIHARLTKTGTELEVDLSQSSGQVGGALNVPWASTRACVAFLLTTISGGTIQNDGTLEPVRIICPEGSLLRPRWPAAVSVRHVTCQRLTDVLIQAAGRLWPELAVGSSWVGFFSLMAEGVSPRTGRPVVLQDVVGGGTGGHGPRLTPLGQRPGGGGLDAVDTYLSNVALLPAEICEVEYPWRLVSSELVPGSQGAGEFAGGRGVRRVYQVLGDEPQAVVVYSDQTDSRWPPLGVLGGGDGTTTRLEVRDADGNVLATRPKSTMILERGSTVTIITGGGGGWGVAPEIAVVD